jgi:hypothetical protein
MNEDKEVPVRAVMTYGGIEVYVHALLTSALDGGLWSMHTHSTPYRDGIKFGSRKNRYKNTRNSLKLQHV